METLFYLFLIVLLSSSVAGVLLVIMVKKYYWGPSGVPPKQRYKQNEPEGKKKHSNPVKKRNEK